MAKKIYKIEKDLVCNGEASSPKPGLVEFQIQGVDDDVGNIIMPRILKIRKDKISVPITGKHIFGKVTIEIFKKTPDSSEYEKNIETEGSIKKRRMSKEVPNVESDTTEEGDA
jgi:hypothetical protein